MSTPILIGIPASTYVRTARMAFEEKWVEYILNPLQPHSDEVNAIHPFGKVPVLRHDNIRLAETLAICSYLDQTFDGPPLQPERAEEKSKMLQWIGIYNTECYTYMSPNLVIERIVIPMQGGTSDEDRIAASVPLVRHRLEMFDNRLGNSPWLAGKTFSLADMFLGPMLFYIKMIPESEQLMSGLRDLERWYDTISNRDSFKKTMPAMNQ